jgi:predicted ArsR family transcriptional regulator
LHDESRKRLYGFIRRQRRPVTREDAAAALGISRKLAAFHLDKLVEVGLLRTDEQTDAGVHKVGRRPKIYQPSGIDVTVTVPDRRPDVLADILVEAVADSDETTTRSAAIRIARERGEMIGTAERQRVRPGRLGVERALNLAEVLLARYGFEPGREGPTVVRLRNCPFHPLVARSPELVCAISHAFISGLLDGLRAQSTQAVLRPRVGECCVEVTSRS